MLVLVISKFGGEPLVVLEPATFEPWLEEFAEGREVVYRGPEGHGEVIVVGRYNAEVLCVRHFAVSSAASITEPEE